MAADPKYDIPHASTIQTGMYGCYNKPRSKENDLVYANRIPEGVIPSSKSILAPDGASYSSSFPFRMSTTCRYDHSLTDPRCTNCVHRGDGEIYDEAIRAKASLTVK
jgi:hypothetical protein